MLAAVVGGAIVLAVGISQRPSVAQEANQTKPDEDSGAKSQQALLDELDEVRVREEVLKLHRDADRKHLQQQVQQSRMFRSLGGLGGGFGGGSAPTEEQRKQSEEHLKQQRREAERSLDEAEAEYLKTTRELTRISRKRAELERRVGGEASRRQGSEGPERGVIDQVEKVAGIVRQVQDEVAKFRQGEPARHPLAGTEFLRVGNIIINPANITNIRHTQDDVRVYFTGGEPVIMDKKSFEDLEKRLPIRGR
jgi:hypothetical protein